MNEQLFIPTKIKVGYQERSDTYTKKLAYVIYYDNKGVLRKEKSWESWRENKLKADDYENVPTEGFVLNKKAGGYSTGWNHRQTYCRVWDPRGFEFEISIPNLLFILENYSSVKGKGLEGEFVYAWQGTELVLLPVNTEDYRKSSGFTKLQDGKVSAKDLVPGISYKTKRQEDVIYMGRFDTWFMVDDKEANHGGGRSHWGNKVSKFSKSHIFYIGTTFEAKSGADFLAAANSDVPVSNFANLMDALQQQKFLTKPTALVFKPVTKFKKVSYADHLEGNFYKKIDENTAERYDVYLKDEYEEQSYRDYSKPKVKIGERYSTYLRETVTFKDGNLKVTHHHNYNNVDQKLTEDLFKALNFQELFVTLGNGKTVKYNN